MLFKLCKYAYLGITHHLVTTTDRCDSVRADQTDGKCSLLPTFALVAAVLALNPSLLHPTQFTN